MMRIKSYLIIIFEIFLFVSCETNSHVEDLNKPLLSQSIRLNFHDNILNLDPTEQGNRSEEFVKQLVFDRFFLEDQSSPIFESFLYDSIQSLYKFHLRKDKTFHDGTPVNTTAVRLFFKYLIQSRLDVEPVHSLFSSMEGYGLTQWYREHRAITDSLPHGFQSIDEYSFYIKLSSRQEELLDWLQHPAFTIFSKSDDQFIGSGGFKLIELNEDISAKLIRQRPSNNKIDAIQLSFIKNYNLVYSEFFRGSLDIILYNPHTSIESEQTDRLNKLLDSKYVDYQLVISNKAIVKYAELINFHDTTLLKKVSDLSITKTKKQYPNRPDNFLKTLHSDSLTKSIMQDSTFHSVQWYSNILNDTNQYFVNTKTLEFVKTNSENLNQTEPQIVIREKAVEYLNEFNSKNAIQALIHNANQDNNSKYMILELFPEYVIYNNRLLGIESNTNLSEMVKNAHYQHIKTY